MLDNIPLANMSNFSYMYSKYYCFYIVYAHVKFLKGTRKLLRGLT